jgi:alcohol dehydrogenase class IV
MSEAELLPDIWQHTLQRVSSFRMPPITIGLGSREQLPEITARYGKRVCVVTGPRVSKEERVQGVFQTLEKAGFEVGVFSKIPCDPPIETIKPAVDFARSMRADVVLGLGGGSPLDVAKVVAVLLEHEVTVESMIGIGNLPGRGRPTILVPTTAGAGSEVSPNSILSDTANHLKKGVVSDHLIADEAVVDPELCLSLPPGPTAYTGMDALTHAIESFTNKFAVPLVDGIALEAVRRISASLREAVRNGESKEARYEMSLGSLFGGLCLRSVNTAAVHALAYPLGGRFDVPHGIANSLLLPHVLRFNDAVANDRHQQIARAMGVDDVVAGVEALSKDVGTDRRMREFSVKERHLPEMARAALEVQRLLKNNPRPVTEADALEIYRRAF